MFISFASVANKYSQNSVMKSFNVHGTLKADMSTLFDTIICTVGYYEYVFQNPVNRHTFSQR